MSEQVSVDDIVFHIEELVIGITEPLRGASLLPIGGVVRTVKVRVMGSVMTVVTVLSTPELVALG